LGGEDGETTCIDAAGTAACVSRDREKGPGGFPLDDIACWLQDECFEYEGAPREAVVILLKAFKASVPTVEIRAEMPHPLETWGGVRRAAIDVDAEIARLQRIVGGRIARKSDVEQAIGMPIDGMRQDLRLKCGLLTLPRKIEKREKQAERTARRRRAQAQRESDKQARALHDAHFPPIVDWDE
jgi:hypothetical protein